MLQIHPPVGDASQCFVLAAVLCDRQRVGGVGSGSASSERTDLGIQCGFSLHTLYSVNQTKTSIVS